MAHQAGSTASVSYSDGHVTDGADLRTTLSADIFQRQEHYDLAGALAMAAAVDDPVRLVLHNLLALKSDAVRDISAALFIWDEGPTKIGGVIVPPSLIPALRLFRPDVNFLEDDRLSDVLVSGRVALTSAVKALLHRFYRLSRKRLKAGQPVVRAWVDVTLKMYADEAASSQIRVFPFHLNRGRQLAFVEFLQQNNASWSRDGLPYPLAAILKLIVAKPQSRATQLAALEHEGFRKFALEIERADIGVVYTSDEFEVGSVSAGAEFGRAGIKYVNSAHGVGFYCGNTAYSQFRYLTESQREFYSRSSPTTDFVRRETSNFEIFSADKNVSRDAVIVYVHQDFAHAGLKAEAVVEHEIIRQFDTIQLPEGVETVVKVHPNADPAVLQAQLANCRVATSWNDLAAKRMLFLLVNSTAYYDLVGHGDIAVYKDVSFWPEVYLEGDHATFDLRSLENLMTGWLDPAKGIGT